MAGLGLSSLMVETVEIVSWELDERWSLAGGDVALEKAWASLLPFLFVLPSQFRRML